MTQDAERIQPDDPYLNYCLWPYQPVRPGVGKLRASSLLYYAVESMRHGEWVRQVLSALRTGLGDFRCVYGIKRKADQWGLEFYIYDYARTERKMSVAVVEAASGGLLTFPTVPDHVPYFMFSFDLDERAAANSGQIDPVHVYIGNPGSDVSSGIAYAFSRAGQRRLENFYFFFDGHRHRREIADKMDCSVFAAGTESRKAFYRRELEDCGTVCLANKPQTDTIYYSGICSEQLMFFLAWMEYPPEFQRFVAEREHELDHLLFDVGVDYTLDGGRPTAVRNGIYGVV